MRNQRWGALGRSLLVFWVTMFRCYCSWSAIIVRTPSYLSQMVIYSTRRHRIP
ncbi:hypothetical protein clg_03 [Corynebacterium phage CL31]|nr:hypothetical protein clg_03 [Corynebacterium phage CL31]